MTDVICGSYSAILETIYLALNDQQWLICHKPSQTKLFLPYMVDLTAKFSAYTLKLKSHHLLKIEYRIF